MAPRRRLILWFRNDLRLLDNVIVAEAVQRVKKGLVDEVVPLYCYDPRSFITTPWGNPKTGSFRAQFLVESVLQLQAGLQGVGTNLWVFASKPEDAISDLLVEGGVSVLAQSEVTSEETRVEKGVRGVLQGKGKLELLWGLTLYHIDDVPFREDLRDLGNVFTPFKQKVEKECRVRPALPAPLPGQLPPPLPDSIARPTASITSITDINTHVLPPGTQPLGQPTRDDRGVLDFKGGEAEALQRLKYYLWDSDLLASYFDTRNGMLGGDYSTKFAPWLAAGCLSPRTIYHEIKKYEKKRTENKSTYWVIFELIWRDFFRFFALKHGNSIFFRDGVEPRSVRWNNDEEAFRRWRDGQTGWPLVDANMRELKATGFMSNRGRQNVASFLALDLQHDWRAGADWFESVLLDYDVTSNWGNWVAAAGMTGGRINKFNITKQSKDYDLEGDYIRTWVPELAGVPSSRIHEPWLMSKAEQQQYGVVIGQDYPQPMKSAYSWAQQGGGPKGAFKGSSGGYRSYNGGARGGRQQKPRPKSNFELYG